MLTKNVNLSLTETNAEDQRFSEARSCLIKDAVNGKSNDERKQQFVRKQTLERGKL